MDELKLFFSALAAVCGYMVMAYGLMASGFDLMLTSEAHELVTAGGAVGAAFTLWFVRLVRQDQLELQPNRAMLG